jgi:16S rRNA (cytosine967-C5)-methyltransferase
MATTSRALALRVLREVTGTGPTLADRLARPDVAALDRRDRAFLQQLVLGTLRRRGALDHALGRCLTGRFEDLQPEVQDVLRLGAYQVLEMRLPDRAAVSESVDLARSAAPRAAGLVNAVLRRLAREGAAPEPDAERDPLGWLTTTGSLPHWLAQRWVDALGARDAVARARAALGEPPVHVRLNPRRPAASDRLREVGIELEPLGVPGAFRASATPPPDLVHSGDVYAQDVGSQLVARLSAEGGGLVLDACAAPGSKSTLLADSGARVVAGELSGRRRRTLAELVRRWGATVTVVGHDARRPPFREGSFDTVLLDAPCSGLGTLARHPDIRWRASAADVARHAVLQAALIDALAPLVRAGGRLVYATCSLEPEENEQVVHGFLARHPRFAPAPPPPWAAAFASGAYLRTSPERTGGDGFFAAVLATDGAEGRDNLPAVDRVPHASRHGAEDPTGMDREAREPV